MAFCTRSHVANGKGNNEYVFASPMRATQYDRSEDLPHHDTYSYSTIDSQPPKHRPRGRPPFRHINIISTSPPPPSPTMKLSFTVGALVAGLGFALGPTLVAHLGDTAMVVAAPALPLLLLAAEARGQFGRL